MADRPDDQVAEEILTRSGNGFQCRVATAFRKEGWEVLLSPYYVDGATDKPREFDMLCERRISFRDAFQMNHELILQLVVECKYVAQPAVFWFDNRDEGRAKNWLQWHTPFPSNNVKQGEHHYIRAGGQVAKLFASASADKRQEENEPIFKALAQCLGGLTQRAWDINLEQALRPMAFGGKKISKAIPLRYPVIIHSGSRPFYRANVGADGIVGRIDANFVLEVNYAYFDSRRGQHHQEYFLVDVVNFGRLGEFLAALTHEVDIAKELVGYS